MQPLPPGPTDGAVRQTVHLHRDPLGMLAAARARHGDVFTLRPATVRPIVVVAAAAEVEELFAADPGGACAGEPRRRILPIASPRSVFGGDGHRHEAAREPIEPAFARESVARHRGAMAALAAEHVARWPRGRPFRLLPRMRALVDDVFVRCLLGVRDEHRARLLAGALRRMLWTPGNPPLSIPGERNGLLGAAATALFERRRAPLARLLGEEVDARRRGGDGDDVLALALRAAPWRPTGEVVDELLPLLMAAQEPAAAALTWLLDRLGRAPEHANRMRDAGDADPLAGAIVRETLRLRPPALAGLRRLTSPRTVAGHALPAGVTVMLPIPVLHRDPTAFPDPGAFRPERWTTGPPPPQGTFLPFGGGARRCLGEHLALASLHTIAHAVLAAVTPRPILPEPERMVLRGTILVPHRSGLVRS